MKRFVSILVLAIAVCSCADLNIETFVGDGAEKEPRHSLTIDAGMAGTKTMIVPTEEGYAFQWSETDEVKIYETTNEEAIPIGGGYYDENEERWVSSEISIDANGKASFETYFDSRGTMPQWYSYFAIKSVDSWYDSYSARYIFELPRTQVLRSGSFDSNADVLVSKPVKVEGAIAPESLSMQFARVGTVVKMRLTGLPAGASLKGLTFYSYDTVEENYGGASESPALSGSMLLDPEDGSVGIDWGQSNIVLAVDESSTAPVADEQGCLDVWFRTMAAELTEFTVKLGLFDTYGIMYGPGVVDTDGNDLIGTKVVHIPDNGRLEFKESGMTEFSVDMSENIIYSPSFTVSAPAEVETVDDEAYGSVHNVYLNHTYQFTCVLNPLNAGLDPSKISFSYDFYDGYFRVEQVASDAMKFNLTLLDTSSGAEGTVTMLYNGVPVESQTVYFSISEEPAVLLAGPDFNAALAALAGGLANITSITMKVQENVTSLAGTAALVSVAGSPAIYATYSNGAVNLYTANSIIFANQDCSGLFAGMTGLERIHMVMGSSYILFDTRNVTDMSNMFKNCPSMSDSYLTYYDYYGNEMPLLKTDNVTTIESMYEGCSSLTNVCLCYLNTANVTDMSNMFKDCSHINVVKLHSERMGYYELQYFDFAFNGTTIGIFDGMGSANGTVYSEFDCTQEQWTAVSGIIGQSDLPHYFWKNDPSSVQ